MTSQPDSAPDAAAQEDPTHRWAQLPEPVPVEQMITEVDADPPAAPDGGVSPEDIVTRYVGG